jgi:dUTP pyrophosphatase
MVTIQIKKLLDTATIPTRGSDFAAGYDLYATENYLLQPLERKLFKTGISMAIPPGRYGRIAPRSGLAFKDGIDTMAGVIDEDYRGDIGVILINLGQVPKGIQAGDKIAQIIIENYTAASFTEVQDLPASVRADGGFGSTDTPRLGVDKAPTPTVSPIMVKYQQAGGIPIRKRYSDEVKERQAAGE